MAKTIITGESFSVLSFQDNPNGSKVDAGIRPHSVKRSSDEEVFTIGDTVTNGMFYEGRPMQGAITGFSILEGNMFVNHTWSGVGMNLESLTKVLVLPSKFQPHQKVWLRFWGADVGSKVISVHFYNNTAKYDLEVIPYVGDVARIYNVEERMLSETK